MLVKELIVISFVDSGSCMFPKRRPRSSLTKVLGLRCELSSPFFSSICFPLLLLTLFVKILGCASFYCFFCFAVLLGYKYNRNLDLQASCLTSNTLIQIGFVGLILAFVNSFSVFATSRGRPFSVLGIVHLQFRS